MEEAKYNCGEGNRGRDEKTRILLTQIIYQDRKNVCLLKISVQLVCWRNH